MREQIKVIAPAIVLIIVVAAGGAYVLNQKNQSPVPATEQTTTSQEQKPDSATANVETFDQLVDEITSDANDEATEYEASIDQTAASEAAADDSIINATSNQTYDAKF